MIITYYFLSRVLRIKFKDTLCYITSRGSNRAILTNENIILLTRAGLKNHKIGKVIRLDYSTISIGRKRLRGKIFDNTNL